MKKYQQRGGVNAFTFVYTSDRIDACGVRMYTDRSSEVCTLRFGNSFTLPVVTPQDLIDLAHEILSFARDAHDFHYPELLEDETPSVKGIAKTMSELQQKLEDCGVVEAQDPRLRSWQAAGLRHAGAGKHWCAAILLP